MMLVMTQQVITTSSVNHLVKASEEDELKVKTIRMMVFMTSSMAHLSKTAVEVRATKGQKFNTISSVEHLWSEVPDNLKKKFHSFKLYLQVLPTL